MLKVFLYSSVEVLRGEAKEQAIVASDDELLDLIALGQELE